MGKSKITRRLPFWMTVGVIFNFLLFNVPLNDNSSWIQTLAPDLNGQIYPHLATALLIYGISILFIIIAFIYFTIFTVKFLRAKRPVPIGLKGYWTLSLIALSSIVLAILSLRFPHLSDIRISAALNNMFTMTFLVTGILAEIYSED